MVVLRKYVFMYVLRIQMECVCVCVGEDLTTKKSVYFECTSYKKKDEIGARYCLRPHTRTCVYGSTKSFTLASTVRHR